MGAQFPFEPLDPIVQSNAERHDLHHQPRLRVAEALQLPALCGGKEIAALCGITASQFHKLNRKGAYDRFKVTPAIGPRCFSGLLLGRYLSGEPLVDIGFWRKTFGRKRA